MLDNNIVNGHISNINFNIHDNNHMVRATPEGIAFALIYGIELLKNDGVVIENLKVGNDNLFLSEVFSKTIANTHGHHNSNARGHWCRWCCKSQYCSRDGVDLITIQFT